MQLAKIKEKVYNEYLSLQNEESALSYFVASFEAYSRRSQIISFIDFADFLDNEISNKVISNGNRLSVRNRNHLIFINHSDIDYGYKSLKFNIKDHWYIFTISFQLSHYQYLSQYHLRNFEETKIRFPLIIETPYQTPIEEETKLKDDTYFRNPKVLDFLKRLFTLSYKDYQVYIKDLSEFFKVYSL